MKFWIGVLAIMLFQPAAWAHEEPAVLREVDQKLARLEEKVNRWDAVQAEMVQKQSEIVKELQVLKIWIRRNRGG